MIEFSYADEFSSDYDLYVCNFDGSSPTVLNGSEFAANQTEIVGTNEFLIINNNYSAPGQYVFQVGKVVNCKFESITDNEYSKINRWLNRKQSQKFKIKCDNVYWLGRFNIAPIVIGGLIYGLELTFISDYPYGFLDDIYLSYKGKDFTLYSQSDEVGFELPYITIKILEDGDLTIRNSQDTEIFELKNCSKNEVITVDNKHCVITSTDKNHLLYDNFNWNFIKIGNTYNNIVNNYTSSLNIEFNIKYSPVRKVALY